MTDKPKILVIDDEVDMLETSSRLLRRMGFPSITLHDSTNVAEMITEHQPDLILTDLIMPKLGGMEVLKLAQRMLPGVPVIIITGFATVDSAVKAIKEGAFDYLSKPFSYDQLEVTVRRAVERQQLKVENARLRSQLEDKYNFDNIIGAGGGMQGVVETIRKISASDANILVLGESGTGKELIARSIHANSKRKEGPFVAVNCASLPNALLESELFGHEKGAFTGAHTSKAGLMELAHRGTLFLDEIGEMNKEIQAKLLRALELRAFRRVGGTKEIEVDIRILAATNRDLEEATIKGEFREDLYYRLNVITLYLPALRERPQDITLLARHFLEQFSEKAGKTIPTISAPAMQILVGYLWPGNVRELKNIMERAVALCEGDVIIPGDLPERLHQKRVQEQTVSLDVDLPFHEAKAQWIETFEIQYLKRILERYHGNISEAARACGVDRKTIHRLLAKYQLQK